MSGMNSLARTANTVAGQMIPSWMTAMRQAAQKCIKQEDIEAIVKKQVEKAKEGDPRAIAFVFGQVLGGGSLKGATIVQNNYHAPIEPHLNGDAGRASFRRAKPLPAVVDEADDGGPEARP